VNDISARPSPDIMARAESDLLRRRTDQIITQSLLLVGELRTRTNQLQDLVADLTQRAAAAQGDDDAC
jgi:hypothetical protein